MVESTHSTHEVGWYNIA